jgi:magnesium-transporting ATPase (P-type)
MGAGGTGRDFVSRLRVSPSLYAADIETDMIETQTNLAYSIPASDVFKALASRPQGLTGLEAAEQLKRIGPNALRKIKGRPLYLKFLANFTHLMAILLWVGGIVAVIAKMPQLALAVWMVNVINGIFSFWQEYRAEKATEALRRLLPDHARVLRDGEEQRILAEELVPGDVVLLAEGDRISADARLVQEADLRIDQSTLTGESRPLRKSSGEVTEGALSRLEMPNLVFAGTNVASGTGKAVVVATGMQSELGKIANLTQSVEEELSPLQKEMRSVTKIVTLTAVAVGLAFFILAVALAHITLAASFIFALGMIVAFVPEGLLPTVTLSLAMGSQRMARRNALIKRLSAVETLGCTTVICTDKTGTLTQNEMTVREIWLGGRRMKVSGAGYEPKGEILLQTEDGNPGGDALSAAKDSDLRTILLGAGLCNNARINPPQDETSGWTILGDPTEAALKVVALKSGLDLEAEEARMPRWRELPFESRRKRMSTIHFVQHQDLPDVGSSLRSTENPPLLQVFVKGAPKEVLDLCTRIQWNDGPRLLEDDPRRQIMAINDDYARGGLRVLAIAQREMVPDATAVASRSSDALTDPLYAPGNVERDLTFLGLVAMMDPPRIEALDAVEKCNRAGIRVIMITGDYGLTAESIARTVGIVRGGTPRIITGFELDMMKDQALKEALNDEVVFARVAPEHKLRVVSILQEAGEVVAVTGDGVNDAPALKKADIGVAMGFAGTDVAKEAADMILTDDNFASIVNAIEEGRAVYANIRKFTTYIFTSNAPEAVPFILFALSGARIPLALNIMQVLSIDLGTDIMPALALGAEPPEPGVMDKPPRDLKEHVITRSLLLRAYVWLGGVQSLAAMAAFYYMYWMNGHWGKWIDLPSSGALYGAATAMALSAVVTTQIGNLFSQRSERASIFRLPLFHKKLLWIGIGVELLLVLLIDYAPFFQKIMGTAAFPLRNWWFLFAWTPALLLVDEFRKLLMRKAPVVKGWIRK